MRKNIRVAILGGGPAGLFMFKRLLESGKQGLHITIFEKKTETGKGLPYSTEGAGEEHVTNVSGNEIPLLVTPISDWIKTVAPDVLGKFKVNAREFNDYKVLPRLLFGQYLSAQFNLLLQHAKQKGINCDVHINSAVTDVVDEAGYIKVIVAEKENFEFDKVIICTGHYWPKKHEGNVQGYYDSPYPPSKLVLKINHQIAISGSSLTAVDAIRTLTRNNGAFEKDAHGNLTYHLEEDSAGFKIMMHTRNGMLPAVRFHLEDSHLENDALLTEDEIAEHIKRNEGFLSLDYLFEKDFKEIFRDKRPAFYEKIKLMNVEDFVSAMMDLREHTDAFNLLEAEYVEAEKSIKRKESVYWKEMLGVLSFAINYPAKHFSAEDMQRLQKVLLPLISIVIAYIPQSSAEQLLALHKAGLLEIVTVGEDSDVAPESGGGATYHYIDQNNIKQSVYFKTYINCIGQPHLSYKEFPFKSMLDRETVVPARLKFKSAAEGKKEKESSNEQVEQHNDGNFFLNVSGVAINDNFEVIGKDGIGNNRIYLMAVPYMGGFNPDYSGLDFCEEASSKIIEVFFN